MNFNRKIYNTVGIYPNQIVGNTFLRKYYKMRKKKTVKPNKFYKGP